MTMEEDLIDQATSARRERLRALRAAKEYASMPDGDGAVNQNNEIESQDASNGLEQKAELLSKSNGNPKNINDKVEDTEEAGENEAPNMKFRNYLPHDKHLQEGKLAPVELPKFEDPVGPALESSEKIEDPFVNIALKKPNWDLRRDVQKRLDKLERRTQKALYELMLEQEKEKVAKELENTGTAD